MSVMGEAGCGGDHGFQASGVGWRDDLVRGVVDLTGQEFSLAEGEEKIPFDEPVFEGVDWGRGGVLGDVDRCPVCGLRLVLAGSGVGELILDLADGEVGGEVVESELGTSKGDAEGVGAIEGEEIDAGSALGIEDVGADIRFEESPLAG